MAATNPRLGTMAAIRGGMETDPALAARIAAPTAFRSASRSSSDSTSARLTTNMSRLYGQAPGGDGAPGRSGPGQPRPFLETISRGRSWKRSAETDRLHVAGEHHDVHVADDQVEL